MKVVNHLNGLLEIGSEILEELGKDTPSIDKLQKLYNIRSEKVANLSVTLSNNSIEQLEYEEKTEVDNLFKSLQSNEKIINQKLITLSNKKENELDLLNQNLKAEKSYREQQKRSAVNPRLLNKNLQG